MFSLPKTIYIYICIYILIIDTYILIIDIFIRTQIGEIWIRTYLAKDSKSLVCISKNLQCYIRDFGVLILKVCSGKLWATVILDGNLMHISFLYICTSERYKSNIATQLWKERLKIQNHFYAYLYIRIDQ
jgi:hypothetical protein